MPGSLAFQDLEMVTGWTPEVTEFVRRVQLFKLACRYVPQWQRTGTARRASVRSVEDVLSALAPKRLNHVSIITRNMCYVKLACRNVEVSDGFHYAYQFRVDGVADEGLQTRCALTPVTPRGTPQPVPGRGNAGPCVYGWQWCGVAGRTRAGGFDKTPAEFPRRGLVFFVGPSNETAEYWCAHRESNPEPSD